MGFMGPLLPRRWCCATRSSEFDGRLVGVFSAGHCVGACDDALSLGESSFTACSLFGESTGCSMVASASASGAMLSAGGAAALLVLTVSPGSIASMAAETAAKLAVALAPRMGCSKAAHAALPQTGHQRSRERKEDSLCGLWWRIDASFAFQFSQTSSPNPIFVKKIAKFAPSPLAQEGLIIRSGRAEEQGEGITYVTGACKGASRLDVLVDDLDPMQLPQPLEHPGLLGHACKRDRRVLAGRVALAFVRHRHQRLHAVQLGQ